MGAMHEQILVYGASEAAERKFIFLPLEENYRASRFSHKDSRGFYDTGDLTARQPPPSSGQRATMERLRSEYQAPLLGCTQQPTDRDRLMDKNTDGISQLTMREKLNALDEAGYIHWPDKVDGFPRYKKYLHRAKGRLVGDLWTDINVINSQATERTGFPTQKPEALLRRILQMGSRPGDTVLDCFAGSGTTAAVAHKMGRRWVIVELESDTVDKYIRPRLARVVSGADPGGITEEVRWAGGSGFRVLVIGDSIYEQLDGRVLLAERVTNGAFAYGCVSATRILRSCRPTICGSQGQVAPCRPRWSG